MATYAIISEDFFVKKPFWIPHKLHHVISERANPRSKGYMIRLLHETFPGAKLLDVNDFKPEDELILLYPDAIGLGWSHIEKKYGKKFSKITILNGRKRQFKLTWQKLWGLRLRRFLEISFLCELLFVPLFFMGGCLLVFKDKLSRCK